MAGQIWLNGGEARCVPRANWSCQLSDKYREIDMNKLATIGIDGLLRWYTGLMSYITPLAVNLPYKQKLQVLEHKIISKQNRYTILTFNYNNFFPPNR